MSDRAAEGEAAVRALFPQVATNPALHVHKLDLERDAVLLLKLSEEEYRAASFLDDRILTPDSLGCWMPLPRLLEMVGAAPSEPDLCFIFHQGHVGSTLVSRLLDETGFAFGVREPAPLRTLAELSDAGTEHARLRGALLRVWSRRFRSNARPIVKATSHTERIGAELLHAAPNARAITLHLKSEPYLAALLSGPNTPIDLAGFAQERAQRVGKLFGTEFAPARSLGEQAALAWLAECGSQARMLNDPALSTRVLDVDFDAFLVAPAEQLAAIAAHFRLPQSDYDAIVSGSTFTRYSKAPEHAYSPELRRELLAQARTEFADEISRGLAWLDAAAKQSEEVQRLLIS